MSFVILPLKPKSFLFGFVNRKGIFAIKEEKQAIMRSFERTDKTEQKAPCFDEVVKFGGSKKHTIKEKSVAKTTLFFHFYSFTSFLKSIFPCFSRFLRSGKFLHPLFIIFRLQPEYRHQAGDRNGRMPLHLASRSGRQDP